jgi:hypothetical protein
MALIALYPEFDQGWIEKNVARKHTYPPYNTLDPLCQACLKISFQKGGISIFELALMPIEGEELYGIYG